MQIKLTSGYEATIDLSDYYKVLGYTWWPLVVPTNVYACTTIDGKTVLMHRLIRQPPDDLEVDHQDHNGLNNRWRNLRICTHSQNHANRPAFYSDTYRGVSPTRYGRWRARVMKQGQEYYAGTFDTPEEAARARDCLALELFGEFAILNFPKAG
jgi:hypothetical protein